METKDVQFRLPTKEEFENLIKHFSRWSDEKKSLEIENSDGHILVLSADGYYYGNSNFNAGSTGNYWSSTMDESDNDYAYYFYFDSNYKGTGYYNRTNKHTVRLVSDEPFEGSVEFNGIWWKAENELCYFTFDEAIKLFKL